MKRFHYILLILSVSYFGLGIILLIRILQEKPPLYSARGKWTLVWEDDFNGSALDRNKWVLGDQSCGYNGSQIEIRSISQENIAVKNGCLTLADNNFFRKDPTSLNYSICFISGRVSTSDKYTWRYGRFEVRAKLPEGEGLLSEAGLQTVRGSSREIHMMMMSGQDLFTVFMNNRWGADRLNHYWQENDFSRNFTDFSKGFHNFAIEWEPQNIRWYVDNNEIYRTNQNVPDQPLSLTLGTSAGNLYLLYLTSNFSGKAFTLPDLPKYFIIDWVRVYQRR